MKTVFNSVDAAARLLKRSAKFVKNRGARPDLFKDDKTVLTFSYGGSFTDVERDALNAVGAKYRVMHDGDYTW